MVWLQPWSESCCFVMEDSCCFFQYYLAAHLTASLNLSPGFIYKVWVHIKSPSRNVQESIIRDISNWSWNFIKPFQSLCSWYRYLSYCFYSLGKNSSIHKLDLILLFILKMKTEWFCVRYLSVLSHYTALQNAKQPELAIGAILLFLRRRWACWTAQWPDHGLTGVTGDHQVRLVTSLHLSSPPPTSDPVTQHHPQTGEIIYNSK